MEETRDARSTGLSTNLYSELNGAQVRHPGLATLIKKDLGFQCAAEVDP